MVVYVVTLVAVGVSPLDHIEVVGLILLPVDKSIGVPLSFKAAAEERNATKNEHKKNCILDRLL